VLDAVNASGQAYLTHTVINGQLAVRMAVGGVRTEHRHVLAAWDALRAAADRPPAAVRGDRG
jgi:aromatic-L-amino-acid decarboxylase